MDYLLVVINSALSKSKRKSLGGLEPPTSRLTVERANQLRHRDGYGAQKLNKINFQIFLTNNRLDKILKSGEILTFFVFLRKTWYLKSDHKSELQFLCH